MKKIFDHLSYIGHCGNFMIIPSDKKTPENLPKGVKTLYNTELFNVQGVFGEMNGSTRDVMQTFESWTKSSNQMRILSFGIDSVFSVNVLPGLESLGILKYLDLGTPMGGFKLPQVFGLPLKGAGKDLAGPSRNGKGQIIGV